MIEKKKNSVYEKLSYEIRLIDGNIVYITKDTNGDGMLSLNINGSPGDLKLTRYEAETLASIMNEFADHNMYDL